MGKCSKHEVMYALRLILSPQIASNSVKACLRAGAMYNISRIDTEQKSCDKTKHGKSQKITDNVKSKQ